MNCDIDCKRSGKRLRNRICREWLEDYRQQPSTYAKEMWVAVARSGGFHYKTRRPTLA